MSQFIDESKRLHSIGELKDYWTGAFDPTNPDTARHHLMLSYALPIMDKFSPKKILTLGDNRARDAAYCKAHFPDAWCIASDLDCKNLIPAVSDHYVDEAVSVDVENIPYEDNSVDFILTKESFHHWPRPLLGLYEALRVAKYGVILIEPNDNISKVPDAYPSKDEYHDSYEEVGNYKYQVSLREIQKVAWSLYYPAVVSRGFNDPYRAPFDFQSYVQEKNQLDQLGFENKRQFNLMMICILKVWDENLYLKLDSTYDRACRPLNQYLKQDKL